MIHNSGVTVSKRSRRAQIAIRTPGQCTKKRVRLDGGKENSGAGDSAAYFETLACQGNFTASSILSSNVGDMQSDSTIIQGCRFAIRSQRFMDAYRKGLNGKQAA
ncbi:hypothetical protein BS17DRAFT_557059 [Gyrodon lividus]|nr:hypothetical protein BS17DRAFT_557059 [Gyrodon lividus]